MHVRVLPKSAYGSGEVVLDTQGGTATAVPGFLHGHGEHGLEFVVLLLGFLHVQHHVEVLLFLGRHRRRVVIIVVLVVIATTPPGACSIGRVVGSSLVTIAGPIVTTIIVIVILVIILVVVIVAVVAGGVRGVRCTVVVACGAAGFGVSCGSFRSCGSLSSGGCSIVLPGFAPCSL